MWPSSIAGTAHAALIAPTIMMKDPLREGSTSCSSGRSGRWARWLSWRWMDCSKTTSVFSTHFFPDNFHLFYLFFQLRSWKQKVRLSYVNGFPPELVQICEMCGQNPASCSSRVQKLHSVIIEGVRRGRCLPFHFTVPTWFMNEQPPGSRDWPTSSARTSQPLACFQAKCVHSAHFSTDRELMQLGGVPGNTERAGVFHSLGSTYVDVWEPRWHIFASYFLSLKKGKKREWNYGT